MQNATMDILIPDGYFLSHVKKHYSDAFTAFFREVLQNSVDAGATTVDIFANKDTGIITVVDNGCGMDFDVLKRGLLTFGGSVKSAGSTGGFGEAKVLILFSQDSYSIHTRNHLVEGAGLQYIHDDKAEHFNGTSISVKTNSDFWKNRYGDDVDLTQALRFLERCEIPNVVITFNGEVVECSCQRGKLVRENSLADVYAKPSEFEQYYIDIRHNGVLMFRSYVNGVKQHIVLELKKPSSEVLNANRDGFAQAYANSINSFIQEVVIDKESFDRAKPQRLIWRGQNKSFNSADIRECFERLFKELVCAGVTPEMAESVTDSIKSEVNDIQASSLEQIEAAVDAIKSVENFKLVEQAKTILKQELRSTHLFADFVIDFVPSDDMADVPLKAKPGSLSAFNKKVINEWRKTIGFVFAINGIQANFVVGFVIDPKAKASFRRENGIDILLINPYEEALREDYKGNRAIRLLMLACHEVAHRYSAHHNEEFVCRSEELLQNCLFHLAEFKDEFNNGKNYF